MQCPEDNYKLLIIYISYICKNVEKKKYVNKHVLKFHMTHNFSPTGLT